MHAVMCVCVCVCVCVLQERELALHSEGQSVRVASERPHLLGLDEEMFGAGVVLYYLKVRKRRMTSNACCEHCHVFVLCSEW